MSSDLVSLQGAVDDLAGMVAPVSSAAAEVAWDRLDSLTKPPRSLGRLEELAVRVAQIQDTIRPDVSSKAIILAAGDHGVVAEGISSYPQDVTWQMIENFVSGGAAINQLARSVGAELLLYDVGVARDISSVEGVHHRKVAFGTANMAEGPAMDAEECLTALLVGARAAVDAVGVGHRLLGTGEMGIGNTTAASALTAAFTGADPACVVGSGTGLDAQGVAHKVRIVRRALEVNLAGSLEPLEILAAVGGLEIAALTGVFLGAAATKTCCVADGFISGAAALAAVRICPAARDYILPSHRSVEPGHVAVLEALDLDPVLDLDMRLGEGTGAALAIGLIDAACAMMAGMATFGEAGVSDAGLEPTPEPGEVA